MITIRQLYFDYPGTHALKNICCDIPRGSITALVGPNGSGKTTLMRSISALANPISGSVEIDGVQTSASPRKIHKVCSYLSDFFGLYDNLTVTQSLFYAAWIHQIKDSVGKLVSNTIEELELQEYRNKLAGTLSRGLRQRLAIAQTVIHRPKYILLDEPASGLDPDARTHLAKFLLKLKKEGITFIISSHILAELEDYSTHMMILKKGELIEFSEINETTKNSIQNFELVITKKEEIDATLSLLKKIPEVKIIKQHECKIYIQCDTTKISQNKLLQKCFELNIQIESFSLKKTSLQEHYLNLTQKQEGDKSC